ncbi:MAG: prolipoprotein diacylglyceryl transferase [Dechloromonas sp.]|jgi:phosphatidylglycerol:prolipoprotein diacylglycerol transferase|nr:prolipoprotein diacylglyceryl transferase [Dechloromonas sp.]
MLTHPQFDPVALAIGPVAIHWYGLMYLLAFFQFIALGRLRIRQGLAPMNAEQLDDLLFYGVLGVIVGGRLGQVFFYEPAHYLANPLEILAVWKGGMSFHGGFLGVLVAMSLWARKTRLPWLAVTDFIAPLVPLGLAAGRVGNFINGELWGRITDASLPWAMIFPQSGSFEPRHPSQLYHVALEGLALFALLWLLTTKPRPTGFASGAFLIGYGAFRFITEFFREPDHGIFGQSYLVSMGQWLSLPMIVAGIALIVFACRKKSL